MISARSRSAQVAGSMARVNLWWTQPASVRRPQSGWRNSFALERSMLAIASVARLGEEFLEVIVAGAELIFIGDGDFAEVSFR